MPTWLVESKPIMRYNFDYHYSKHAFNPYSNFFEQYYAKCSFLNYASLYDDDDSLNVQPDQEKHGCNKNQQNNNGNDMLIASGQDGNNNNNNNNNNQWLVNFFFC